VKQAELAENIGISESTLSMILSGKRGIGWDVAKRLSVKSRRKAQWWMDAKLADVFTELERMGKNDKQRRAA
jgi:plasmid maintenance system antidote protein VapI